MHPQIHFNLLSVVIAVVASFLFGWLWHGPLFGKLWGRLNNHSNTKPDTGAMIKSCIIGLIATFLTAYVLVYSTNIWRPSVWGIGADDHWYVYGFLSGFFTWLGFYLAMLLNHVAWKGYSWRLFLFTALYHFINLQIIAMIVAYFYK